jgi:hypothetical protein
VVVINSSKLRGHNLTELGALVTKTIDNIQAREPNPLGGVGSWDGFAKSNSVFCCVHTFYVGGTTTRGLKLNNVLLSPNPLLKALMKFRND